MEDAAELEAAVAVAFGTRDVFVRIALLDAPHAADTDARCVLLTLDAAGSFCLPGGQRLSGETIEAAAKREVRAALNVELGALELVTIKSTPPEILLSCEEHDADADVVDSVWTRVHQMHNLHLDSPTMRLYQSSLQEWLTLWHNLSFEAALIASEVLREEGAAAAALHAVLHPADGGAIDVDEADAADDAVQLHVLGL